MTGTVTTPDSISPPKERWARRAVLYHIYPLSFQDSDGDGLGDLQGIIDRLDYLTDLGVGAVWLSPVYRSPLKDFGYDVSDYLDIDPVFGSLALFDELVAKLHERGMKLMMDFVPNHTSDQHPWFDESRSSRTSPKRDWYLWRDSKRDGSPPNNWLSHFGGPMWTLDERTGQYYLHTFLPEQPDLNWRNEAVKRAMLDVLRYWLRRGVDGFRTDAVYNIIKDREFRDDPVNPRYRAGIDDPYDAVIHRYSRGQAELTETLADFCEILGHEADAFLVSEAYVDIPEMLKLYRACDQHQVHAPLNFNLMALPWSARSYRQFIDQFEASLTTNDWPTYVLGNHDRHRLASRVGPGRSRLLALLQLTLRGMPVVYYGEELGMVDGIIPPGRERDPWGIRVPGFRLGRDGERTPMQWDSSMSAGFTTGEPWLPLATTRRTVNVADERSADRSHLTLYRQLIHERKHSAALLTGTYQSRAGTGDDIFCYLRSCPRQTLLVALNFSHESSRLTVPYERCRLILTSELDEPAGHESHLNGRILRPYEGILVELPQDEF